MTDVIRPPEPTLMFSVALCGDVDLARVPELHGLVEDFRAGPATDIVIDVREVTFMDSTGLAFLARLYREAHERGGALTIMHAGPQVERLIGITGMNHILSVSSN